MLAVGVVAPLRCSLVGFHTELEPVAADGGFRLWFFVKVWMKGGNGLDSLSFSSCLLSLVHRINREKRDEVERLLCVLSCLLYRFFPTDCSLRRGKRFRAELLCFGLGLTLEQPFLKPGSVLKLTLKIFCLCSGCSTGCCIFTTTPVMSL